MGLFWLLLIGFAAYLIYLNTNKSPFQGPGGGMESPLEIMQKRYAGGEITREQFEEMKKHLQP
jgi:putative membrane protein